MKVIILSLTVLILLASVSLCLAQEIPLEKAYSLYYKGKKDTAVKMMEDYVKDHPDARAFYFLGYAYYEMKQFDKAREYFTKAYKQDSFYSPMAKEKK